MPDRSGPYDTSTARQQWDFAAAAYDQFQQIGHDYYRYEFFGPHQAVVCGDVSGLRLLDLGCGNGYFSREMESRGAIVTGVDLSRQQIEFARRHEEESPVGIQYAVKDAERLSEHFAASSFDMVTACVSLQDMPNPERAISGAFHVLRPGGRFVFSITHPCTDVPLREWDRDTDGNKRALKIGRYFEVARIDFAWRGSGFAYEFTTSAVHRTLSWWVNSVCQSGFTIRQMQEPKPSDEAVHGRPELSDASIVPYFLMLDVCKPVEAAMA